MADVLHNVLGGVVDADYTPEESAFLVAMDRYKRLNQRPLPSWREVLAVVRSLGYRVVAEATDLPRFEKVKGRLPGCVGVTPYRYPRSGGGSA